jgi:hypothetical protein
VDVIEILTCKDPPRKYWSDLKTKLKKEGSQLSKKIVQLKMEASDGKKYATEKKYLLKDQIDKLVYE